MENKRVVITGLGVVASNGIGKEDFFKAIFNGVSGIKPITLFATRDFKAKTAGEITGFAPEVFLGAKGLRTLDRSTKLICSAAKLALADARLEITEENTDDIGVVIATNLGSLSSISDFDREIIQNGPRYVNPAFFPNTVLNSPASQVSIKFNIKGLNVTISSGFTASIDAANYAVDFLKLGRLKAILVGGVEELCVHTFLGFYKTGLLAGLDDPSLEISCPFDQRRNGVVLGEGAGFLLLEELECALGRRAEIYAEVAGFGSSYAAQGLTISMRQAMEEARIGQEKVDFICSAANSTQYTDLLETKAIKEVFGPRAKEIPVSSIKSMLGECYSASGLLQSVAAAGAIDRQILPPTINYRQKDAKCDLNYVVNQALPVKVENVLVNASGPCAAHASVLLRKFKG